MTDRSPTGDWARAAVMPAEPLVIPGYEVLGEIGRGGMGVVYKARQAETGRFVALKVLRDGALATSEERARFRIEAESTARLDHPHIVRVFDFGNHDGRPYLAMELVEGGSLDRFLAGRPQPVGAAVRLARKLALAVEHAHDSNILHRDLKPSNVLLGADTDPRTAGQVDGLAQSPAADLDRLTPKIGDFGLAKRLDTESTAVTRTGAILGTAGYMAPEQAAGRGADVGPAADVYALGAILYELLTGRPPFQAESWHDAVEQALRQEPLPLRRLRAEVPGDLEAVCLKCLEKCPDRRYPRAGELADDLGRFLDARPVTAVAVSPFERLARLALRDDFVIGDELGRGPQSVVYRAEYGPLKQPVAVKVFAPGSVTRTAWEDQLRRAAAAGATLAHPQVMPALRGGWWDESGYVVTDYLPQGSLAQRLAGRPQPLRPSLQLVEQLAELVSYLHRQGVVHGNLKPSNVLFAAGDIPRLSDFRLLCGQRSGLEPSGEDVAIGAGYLAPELVADPDAEPRPHTDVYGLGLILYELLTGRPAFSGREAPETLERVRSHEPPAPSSVNPEVSPQLDAFCLRCLRKNPWRRFYRAYDLVTRLRSFRVAPAERERPGQPTRRRPPTAAGPESV